MEEDKAAAYYEELARKGEGAARFKQGLGFSSDNSLAPSRGSALASHSSFLNTFVKSSSPTQTSNFEKQAQLEAIQNKLKKKPRDEGTARVSERSSRESAQRHRSRSRERDRYRDRDRHYRRRSRSRSRDKYRESERHKRRRSRNPSVSPGRDRRSERRKRIRSLSPRGRRKDNSRRDDAEKEKAGKEKNGSVDYSQLIQGYEKMTPAERVKARMKLQLAETAEKDSKKGMGSGWERFEFDKDALLDDEELEAAEDDLGVVKHIGQSFRFSNVEARREEQIKAAHDEAMFGAPAFSGSMTLDVEPEADNNEKESNKTEVGTSLLSEKVIAKQQGSWRDRFRKA